MLKVSKHQKLLYKYSLFALHPTKNNTKSNRKANAFKKIGAASFLIRSNSLSDANHIHELHFGVIVQVV